MGLAESAILDISQGRRTGDLHPLSSLLGQVYHHLSSIKSNSGITGIPTFTDLDTLLSGLQKSDLIILAARPAMGKTSMALNIAQNAAAKEGKTVAIFSLEMPKEQLVQRMLCTAAEVDHSRARRGMISKGDMKNLKEHQEHLMHAQVYIDDTMSITVAEMRSKCRRLQREHGLDLVLIDYIQLMQGNPGRRMESRQLEVAEISRALKAMAKELNVPVLALSQLSRLAERSNEPPNLSHLRESGALEQDADVVLLLHRQRAEEGNRSEFSEEEQMKRGDRRGDQIDVIVAKHRNGPTGVANLVFIKEFTAFRDHTDSWLGPRDIDAPPPKNTAEQDIILMPD